MVATPSRKQHEIHQWKDRQWSSVTAEKLLPVCEARFTAAVTWLAEGGSLSSRSPQCWKEQDTQSGAGFAGVISGTSQPFATSGSCAFTRHGELNSEPAVCFSPLPSVSCQRENSRVGCCDAQTDPNHSGNIQGAPPERAVIHGRHSAT